MDLQEPKGSQTHKWVWKDFWDFIQGDTDIRSTEKGQLLGLDIELFYNTLQYLLMITEKR